MADNWRNDLLNEQLARGNKRSKKAKPVKQSASTGISYNVELRKMVREIQRNIKELVIPLLRALEPEYTADNVMTVTDAWSDDLRVVLERLRARWSSPEFVEASNRMASSFVRTADQVNRARFNKNMRSIGLDIYGDSPELAEYLRASANDNARLIRSIPDQYLTQVESIVYTNVRAGGRPADITKTLSAQFGITERRAAFIARDQTAKINGDLVAKRQVNSGFEYFEWDDSDDERVRDRHEEIANKVTAYGKGIYRWDNPPLSDSGTPIIPGQDFGCRCTARPVSNSEVEANQAAGRVAKGVLR